MALFYTSACTDTGSCSRPQRPFTHQSKKLLLQPLTTPVFSLLLSLHILCAFSPTSSFPELILLHKIQSCLDSLPPPSNHFHTCPLYPFPSHSLFLQVFYILLHCPHLLGHPFNPSRLRFSSSSIHNYRKQGSSVLKSNEHVLRLLLKTVLHVSAWLLTSGLFVWGVTMLQQKEKKIYQPTVTTSYESEHVNTVCLLTLNFARHLGCVLCEPAILHQSKWKFCQMYFKETSIYYHLLYLLRASNCSPVERHICTSPKRGNLVQYASFSTDFKALMA